MLALALLLAQAAPVVDPSTFERLGTAGIVAIVLGACIWWLLKDRATTRTERAAEQAAHAAALAAAKKAYDDDVEAHRRQLDIERQANRDMVDRLIATTERTATTLERAAIVMERIDRSSQVAPR